MAPSKKWIADKELFKACMFASELQKNGRNAGLANYIAGQYYGYSTHDVAVARNKIKQFKNRPTETKEPRR